MDAPDPTSYLLLDERIRRFIWAEGWTSLRDAQEQAIPLVLPGNRDVIVAAATAAGKTEAAFFPALTHFLQQEKSPLIVYLSPLKALINDQFDRLERLCESLDVQVWPWHGDVSGSVKERFRKNCTGVLLITPESLEAMLCNRGTTVGALFARTSFFIIDEMHAFIGSERGKQLQSLMHRVDMLIGRKVPRIGLSATLGDMSLAADFLRPGGGPAVQMVESLASGGQLLISVQGFIEPLTAIVPVPLPVDLQVVKRASNSAGPSTLGKIDLDEDEEDDESEPTAPPLVAQELFKVLRGSNNLVFPNSRMEVERYTGLLNELCDELVIPHEFWPHHGSLSKATREDTENALKRKDHFASAVCTNTLELGIDIGPVRSVCQVGAPYSVASLRQRLGRSGRREGQPAILRGYCIERESDGKASIVSELRLRTLQMIAAILLLLEGWFEPPQAQGLHLSTLVQQILSLIAQNNGASLAHIHRTLCAPGAPFASVSVPDLIALMNTLGTKDIVMQESSGLLLHAPTGEREVNHYSFYAAFSVDEEYQVSARGKIMGTLPISTLLVVDQRILFSGKRWIIERIDDEQKTLYLKKSRGGSKPIFSGGAGRVHSKVRARMRMLLENTEIPRFLDPTGRQFLEEARSAYASRDLARVFVVTQLSNWIVLTWMGDPGNEALACLLNHLGWRAAVAGPGLEVQKGGRDLEELLNALCRIGRESAPPLDELLVDASNLKREKWDHVLPENLLRKSYASLNLDIAEAIDWARRQTEGRPAPQAEDASDTLTEMILAAGRDFAYRHPNGSIR